MLQVQPIGGWWGRRGIRGGWDRARAALSDGRGRVVLARSPVHQGSSSGPKYHPVSCDHAGCVVHVRPSSKYIATVLFVSFAVKSCAYITLHTSGVTPLYVVLMLHRYTA